MDLSIIMNLSRYRHAASALVALSLAGCSQGIGNMVELSAAAFSTPESVLLSRDEILALDYAANYFQLEDNPRSVVPLNQATNKQLSWRVGAYQFIHTQAGRVVASDALPDMPLQTSERDRDPLLCLQNLNRLPLGSGCPSQWQRRIVWKSQQGEHTEHTELQHSWVRSSVTRAAQPEPITLLNGSEFSAYRIDEQGEWLAVSSSAEPQRFENTFWQDANSGRIVKARQFLSPRLGYLLSEELVPFQAPAVDVDETP